MQYSLNRRDILKRSALGIGALGLCGVLEDDGRLSAAEGENAGPLDSKRPHFPGRAKRVIHFFLNGGPSHVDTFDPKPMLEKHAGKPLGETLTTERKTGAAFPSPFQFKKYGAVGDSRERDFREDGRAH